MADEYILRSICRSIHPFATLREAEKLICENRERLMTPSCEEEQ
jgi:hypothetical protein